MTHTVFKPISISENRLDKIEYSDCSSDFGNALEYCIDNTKSLSRGKKRAYVSDFATYDTETSSVSRGTLWNRLDTDVGFPYLHQFSFFGKQYLFRENAILKNLFENVLVPILDSKNLCLVIYVHNLSFEFQFFKTVLQIDDVFALKNRRIAKAFCYGGAIEFRCSYLLSNMSLEKFTENYCDELYRKDKELIDYEIIRYPWSELDNELLYYSLMDVVTLHKAIESIMEREHDTLKSIPLTNTGYVRRSCREACLGKEGQQKVTRKNRGAKTQFASYRKRFLKTQLTLEQYNMCVEAFRGGDTHASRFYAGSKLYHVGSYDFASSYPAILCLSAEFPIGKLQDVTEECQNFDTLKWYVKNFWCIMTCVFYDLHLKNPYQTPVPYIPTAKVKRDNRDGIYDNGRIIKQDGYTTYTFLGIELPLILSQYSGNMKVIKIFCARKGYLPNEIRERTFDWYKKKTELKNVDGKEYEYMKSKNRVNSTYGMMVEQIIKDIIEYNADEKMLVSRKASEEEAKEQLENYYSPIQRKFLAYQWGITITAVARVRLHEMINIVGRDFVYCDTDSCKMLNPEKYEKAFEEYNKKWIEYANKAGIEYSAYTVEGEKQILGIADREHDYREFKTLGAKKYCVIDYKGNLVITVAGVPKKVGAQLLGNIDNFRCGYKFEVDDSACNSMRQAWKKMLVYNDDMNETFKIDGHELNIKSNIAILRTTYELSITDEYEELISECSIEYCQDDLY